MSQIRLKWATAGISIGLCLGTLAAIEWVSGRFSSSSNYGFATTFLSKDLANDGQNNRVILGEATTSHGIFPLSPPIYFLSLKHFDAPPGNSPSLLDPKTFTPNPYGPYRSLPFDLPVKSARMSRKMKSGETVFDVPFEIESYARRMTPFTSSQSSQRSYLIFLGCSFAFGEGVQDNQTLAYYAGRKSIRFRPYNYGIMGGSPGDALARLSEIRRGDEIPEKTGWVVYVYMDDHIQRLVGPLSITSTWAGQKLHYYRDKGGKIKTDGHFQDLLSTQISIYRFLSQSNLFRWLGFDWPIRARESDWEFMASIFHDMKQDAEKRLHAKGFALLIFPGSATSRRLIPYLEAKGITYLDYTHWNLNSLTEGKPWIPYDGHPTAETYELVGKSLVRELEKRDE